MSPSVFCSVGSLCRNCPDQNGCVKLSTQEAEVILQCMLILSGLLQDHAYAVETAPPHSTASVDASNCACCDIYMCTAAASLTLVSLHVDTSPVNDYLGLHQEHLSHDWPEFLRMSCSCEQASHGIRWPLPWACAHGQACVSFDLPTLCLVQTLFVCRRGTQHQVHG